MYHSICKEKAVSLNVLIQAEEKRIYLLVGEIISDIHYLISRYDLEPIDEAVLRDVLHEMARDGFYNSESCSTKFKKVQYIISGIEKKYCTVNLASNSF